MARAPDSRGLTAQIPRQLDQKAERSHLTREALADVESGQVIDHQAVQAWADSLDGETPLPLPQ